MSLPQDELRVTFPASPTFTRIGRVTVVGIGLRLGIDVSRVEQLRAAVDAAVTSLQGAGRISTLASWTSDELTVSIGNPEVEVTDRDTLTKELWALVGETVVVEPSEVVMTLPTS